MRRPAELYSGDWVDVYCAVCHRRIYDGEARDEDELGTMCWECHDRALQAEDLPLLSPTHLQRQRSPLDL